MVFPNVVGIIQSVQCPWIEQKGKGWAILLSVHAFRHAVFAIWCQYFWFLGLLYSNLNDWAHKSQAFGLVLNYTTGFPGSTAYRGQIMRFLNLHYHVSKFLSSSEIYLSIYHHHLSCVGFVSLENPHKIYTRNTHTQTHTACT